MSLLDICEREKAQLGQALEDGPQKLEDFCISVFGHADNEDRSGEEEVLGSIPTEGIFCR